MKLIHKPQVHVIASTQIHNNGMVQWAKDENLTSSTCSQDLKDTPINNLLLDLGDDFAGERLIEFAGRHCYRAWLNGRARDKYITNLIDMNHGSVLEHANITFAMQGISRSLSLELIRHRVGIAISQESQRYVDAKDINMVIPPLLLHLDSPGTGKSLIREFEYDCRASLGSYMDTQRNLTSSLDQLKIGGKEPDGKAATRFKKRINEAARSHLPGASETRLVWTANYRLLRHFLFLRGGIGADLEIRRLAVELLTHVQKVAPTVFSDMEAVNHLEGSEDLLGVPVIVHKERT